MARQIYSTCLWGYNFTDLSDLREIVFIDDELAKRASTQLVQNIRRYKNEGNKIALLSFAYVRYLGDLSGKS
jgi:hypothetical protein